MSISQKPQILRNSRAAGSDLTGLTPMVYFVSLVGVTFNGPSPRDIQVNDARNST